MDYRPDATTISAEEVKGPSRKCQLARLRAGAVNARRPRGTRGRSVAKSIDGAEHSARLEDVMAAHRHLSRRVSCIW